MNEAMRAYLDAPIDRRGTHCEKWDYLGRYFGRDDLIAMWVADMDFPTVPEVTQALMERVKHPVYGYTDNGEADRAAEADWLLRRHALAVDADWILYSPGVVDSIFFCVAAFTEPGDAILVQPPVYGPFYQAVKLHGRKLVKNPLVNGPDGWQMDFEGLEACFKTGVKMMLLCSPHNPVGRVWTEAELKRLVDLANAYSVLIISDEIHADFALDGRRQTRLIGLEGAEKHVLLTSATKSFNFAGLRQSSVIAPEAVTPFRVMPPVLPVDWRLPQLTFSSVVPPVLTLISTLPGHRTSAARMPPVLVVRLMLPAARSERRIWPVLVRAVSWPATEAAQSTSPVLSWMSALSKEKSAGSFTSPVSIRMRSA